MNRHDAERAQHSRLSFIHWPTAWLWITAIVAVALLVTVGFAMGEVASWEKDPRSLPVQANRVHSLTHHFSSPLSALYARVSESQPMGKWRPISSGPKKRAVPSRPCQVIQPPLPSLGDDNHLDRRVASRRNVTGAAGCRSAPLLHVFIEGCGHMGKGFGGGNAAAQRCVVHGRSRCAAGALSISVFPS